jgi:hypothetical protein
VGCLEPYGCARSGSNGETPQARLACCPTARSPLATGSQFGSQVWYGWANSVTKRPLSAPTPGGPIRAMHRATPARIIPPATTRRGGKADQRPTPCAAPVTARRGFAGVGRRQSSLAPRASPKTPAATNGTGESMAINALLVSGRDLLLASPATTSALSLSRPIDAQRRN